MHVGLRSYELVGNSGDGVLTPYNVPATSGHSSTTALKVT